MASVHTVPHSIATLYGGQPWDYEARLLVFRCILNSKQGAGTAVFWYRLVGNWICNVSYCNLDLNIYKSLYIIFM